MKKPIIAVSPLWDDEKQSIWMLPAYMDGIKEAGGIPVILPLESCADDALKVFELCGGLLLTGGQDVSPSLYGAEKGIRCGEICTQRDNLDAALYNQALKENKPVLGICRGIQFINAVQGGTLYQDLPMEFQSEINHHMSPPYDRVCHYVNIDKQSPLYTILQTGRLGVNSYHHQAVKTAGKDLGVMAVSEDGLIEGVYHKKQPFVWAVQWHPELSFKSDDASAKIFQAFIGACGNAEN